MSTNKEDQKPPIVLFSIKSDGSIYAHASFLQKVAKWLLIPIGAIALSILTKPDVLHEFAHRSNSIEERDAGVGKHRAFDLSPKKNKP